MPETSQGMLYRLAPERLALRLFVRELKAGALWILLGALALSVMALSSVAFITERVGGALNQQANQLLAGDAVLRSESAIDARVIQQAQTSGLRTAQSASLLSMVRVLNASGSEGAMRLSELRAVTTEFPLRGEIIVRDGAGTERPTQQGPAQGTAWLSVSGAANLGAKVGDQLKVGELSLRLSALIAQQPDASLDYFNAGPRVMLSLADVQKSGLLQEGARVSHRLIVAGDPAAVREIARTWRSDRARGQRIETIRNAQPELRQGLERADRFLGLTALLCVVLAAVAIAMAAKRQATRQMDAAAVMRCLGAEQKTLQRIFLGQLLIAGLLGCSMGVGFAVEFGRVAKPCSANCIASGLAVAGVERFAGRFSGARELRHAADPAAASSARAACVTARFRPARISGQRAGAVRTSCTRGLDDLASRIVASRRFAVRGPGCHIFSVGRTGCFADAAADALAPRIARPAALWLSQCREASADHHRAS
jgi:predicted lysophospholipase L1 biosynthesis ABC-type transport system permease subunit